MLAPGVGTGRQRARTDHLEALDAGDRISLGTAVVAVIAAVISAWQAHSARSSGQRRLELAERVHREQNEPYVIVDIQPYMPGHTLLVPVIENIGSTVARNVRVSSDRPLETTWGEEPAECSPAGTVTFDPDDAPWAAPDVPVRRSRSVGDRPAQQRLRLGPGRGPVRGGRAPGSARSTSRRGRSPPRGSGRSCGWRRPWTASVPTCVHWPIGTSWPAHRPCGRNRNAGVRRWRSRASFRPSSRQLTHRLHQWVSRCPNPHTSK
ncbi:hypothetical protein SUDANB176_07492 (plasmid) [Streptomyces sp. enrichment culture]